MQQLQLDVRRTQYAVKLSVELHKQATQLLDHKASSKRPPPANR